ncbi:hypothetical protein QCE63_36735 [Caballeronia sp. LZ065]|uniref:DUF4286 family protein n=1 Tax=Caballeronia sp. LZ065 TaxID=3038571 RepID=UPI002856297E|nr:DUF4286 family protein [Caballeronia sp. LZ065]MDR5784944.1 hypothetical protein [Caballeronia sp. LZ065]
MNESHRGLLAIWSTIAPEAETDYLHWLTREHVFERVSVPGFCSGRVFKRRDSKPSEYLMLYELDHAEVMSSEGYLTRLNAPTPWTQRIMPTLMHFRRGGGALIHEAGHARGHGGHIAIARFGDELPGALSGERLDVLAQLDGIVAVRVMRVQSDSTSISTREKSMRRSEEGAFSGLIVIEALDHAALDHAVTAASHAIPELDGAFQLHDAVFGSHR